MNSSISRQSFARHIAGCALVAGALWVSQARALDVVAPLGSRTAEAAKQSPSFSPGIGDVLRMLDAKVDPAVVKAYVKAAPIAYNPTAEEIVALKERGVPDDVITALLERGAEVRKQGPQAASQPPASNYAPTVPYSAPAYPNYPYDAGMPSAYADYSYGWPYEYPYGYSYGYPYGYSYGYPYGYNSWWYTYSYPFAFYSPFYFSFYRHHHFDHNHNNFNHFAGHSHNRFWGSHNGTWGSHNGTWGSHNGTWGHNGSWGSHNGTWGHNGSWGSGNWGAWGNRSWSGSRGNFVPHAQQQPWRANPTTRTAITTSRSSPWAPFSGSTMGRVGTFGTRQSFGPAMGAPGGSFHGGSGRSAVAGGSFGGSRGGGTAHFGGGGGGFHGGGGHSGGGGGFHGGGGHGGGGHR